MCQKRAVARGHVMGMQGGNAAQCGYGQRQHERLHNLQPHQMKLAHQQQTDIFVAFTAAKSHAGARTQ